MAGGGNGQCRVRGESVELTYTVHHGDCLAIMPTLAENSVDAIVTDPPYGLEFMGKDWDHGVPGVHFWAEALRAAKPGAHLLAFGGSRTYHRLAVAIEDAGWEIRDTIMWLYGSGFPKSHDVSKAIDREAGAEREVVGRDRYFSPGRKRTFGNGEKYGTQQGTDEETAWETAPATPDAERWQGWGTALKPAHEPIVVARKPLQGTVAANVLEWGTGAINVDATRIMTEDDKPAYVDRPQGVSSPDWVARGGMFREDRKGRTSTGSPLGRWPANVVHDGSAEVTRLFPVARGGAFPGNRNTSGYGGGLDQGATPHGYYAMGDTGSAARFFYCAKASKADRDEGLEGFKAGLPPGSKRSKPAEGRQAALGAPRANHHPTVKPTLLMRWLVRLVTPPGGVVLDPFTGSGSTGKAAMLEGFRFIGIEQDAEYCEIARARIGYAVADRAFGLFDLPEHDDRAMAAD